MVTTLNAAITQVKLLMKIDSQPIAVLTIKSDEVQLLQEQVADLAEQVATLSTSSKGTQPSRSPPCCFHCNQVGHVQHDCHNHKCFNCGRLGHLSKDYWHQGNHNGVPVHGNSVPTSKKPSKEPKSTE